MKQSYAFRQTLEYVTDPPGVTAWLGPDIYPTTRNGLTFGRTFGSNNEGRNRSTLYGPLLAGCIQRVNTSADKHILRCDLPFGPGTYLLNLAIGDIGNPQENHIRVLDGDKQVFQIAISTVAREFADVTGAKYPIATNTAPWDQISQSIECEFNEHVVIEIGRGVPGVNNGSALAFLSLEKIVPQYVANIDETSLQSTDQITTSASPPIFNSEFEEVVSRSVDQGSLSFSLPVFLVTIDEVTERSKDVVTTTFVPPVFTVSIDELSENTVSTIIVSASPPRYIAEVTEYVPASFDNVSAAFTNMRFDVGIEENSSTSVDVISAAASPPRYVASIAEQVSLSVDKVNVQQITFHNASISETSSLSTDRVRVATRDCTPVSKGQIIVVERVSTTVYVENTNYTVEVLK